MDGVLGALAEITGRTTYITPSTFREFLNVSTLAQRQAREAFLANNTTIKAFSSKHMNHFAKQADFRQVVNIARQHTHSGADGVLAGIAKVTGLEAVTLEKRLSNFFIHSFAKLGVPIRRIL